MLAVLTEVFQICNGLFGGFHLFLCLGIGELMGADVSKMENGEQRRLPNHGKEHGGEETREGTDPVASVLHDFSLHFFLHQVLATNHPPSRAAV